MRPTVAYIVGCVVIVLLFTEVAGQWPSSRVPRGLALQQQHGGARTLLARDSTRQPNLEAAVAGSLKADIPVEQGTVKTAGCSSPINQIHYRHDKSDDPYSDVVGLWLGAWSYHDNLASDGWGPGSGGAACTAPPTWGKPYLKLRPKCVTGSAGATEKDWYYQMYNYNTSQGNNPGNWMEVLTQATFYYGPESTVKGAPNMVQRVELTTFIWKADPAPGGTFAEPVTESIGRNLTDVTGTKAVTFKAPDGMVLGELKAVCVKDKANKRSVMVSISQACAMTPKWHPKPFKTPELATSTSEYNCTTQ